MAMTSSKRQLIYVTACMMISSALSRFRRLLFVVLGLVEKAELRLKRGEFSGAGDIIRNDAFDEYIGQLNGFLFPAQWLN